MGVGLLRRFAADAVPAALRGEVAALPAAGQRAFADAYARRGRSTLSAYLLCVLVGGHYAYVGQTRLQLLFWVTLGGLLVWWTIDLVRIPAMVRRHNERVTREILAALTASGADGSR